MQIKSHKSLLNLLRADLTKSDQSLFDDYDNLDWQELIEAAIRFRFAYQINNFLAERPHIVAIVPHELMVRLSKIIKDQLYYNFSQINRLRQILVACENEKKQVILLKGLWLVEYIYKDPKARLSGDIDLLVHPNDMPAFTGIARRLNYAVPSDVMNLMTLAPASNEYSLLSDCNLKIVDLHWSLTHPLKEKLIDEASIWGRSENILIGGVTCRTLSLEDHLLYLCFHAAIHHKFVYVGPRALLDIACVINGPPRAINWRAFVDRSNEFEWSRGVWLILDLIRENLGVSPPEFVLTELAPSDLPSLEMRNNVVEALFLDQFHYDKLSLNVINFIDASALEKIQILFARIFPSKLEIATEFRIPVQSRWFFLNYVRRLSRLAWFHGPRIFQTITKNPARVSEKERSASISDWLG